MSKIEIEGNFSAEQLDSNLDVHKGQVAKAVPKHLIPPHPGFEIVELPTKTLAKFAYKQIYRRDTPDLEIELEHIARLEQELETTDGTRTKQARISLKFHYKRAISLISPHIAAGWNRWSDNVLELFVSEKLHKVVWGSGNCGKSVIMAVLLYTKWRVRPHKRMVVIASRVMADASARVFGYIKDIHINAPECADHQLVLVDSQRTKGIYCQIYDEKENKWVKDDRACIISLPIKVNAKNADIGGNLLGKHPDDRLILAFDEAQELPGSMAEDKIFLNWYTNKHLDIYAWGNPIPVDFYNPESHDLLFKLGAGKLSLRSLRAREKEAEQTTVWSWKDTLVLHLAMTDSPKDDIDERDYYIHREDGTKDIRLHFLAGAENVKQIAEKTSSVSASWYSQVLGFPFIDTTGSQQETVLSGYILKKTRDYPLVWRTPIDRLEWLMGVDPAVSGKRDHASIVCGRRGMMVDGRLGVDMLNGQACRRVVAKEGEDFTDTIIETMFALSQQYNIPLKNIAIETHGVGEVLRYALAAHIEAGKWKAQYDAGQRFYIVNPTKAATDRWLFKTLGNMVPATDMCANINTEYWVALRCAVLTRQIFNMPEFILQQFYNRYLLRSSNGMKYKIEPKDAMRKRGVKSPDDADALCNMFELIRARGFAYKFVNANEYTPFYGEQYDARKKQQIVTSRLGSVSSMLGLMDNMVNVGKRKKREIVDSGPDSV